MKFKMAAISTIILAIAFSLNVQAQMLNNLTIKGTVVNSTAQKIYFSRFDGNNAIGIDTADIDANGYFQIFCNISEPGYFQLHLGDKQYAILILHPDEHLDVELDGMNLIDYVSVKGSPNTEAVNEILDHVNKFVKAQDSLNVVYQGVVGTSKQDSVGKVLIEEYNRLDKAKFEYLSKKIYDEPSLASLLFLGELDINQYMDVYEKLDSVLYPKYSKLSFVSDLHTKVEKKLRLAVGRPAPDFTLPDTANQMVSLSDFRGKVVLIDFWASWCAPCRKESPNMVKYYEKYNSMGFEILSVSLDKKRSDWIRGIREDQLYWTHISDLRGWGCAAGKVYGVSSIPFTVLVDENGKIIAVNLRGAALEQKLDELFMQ